MAKQITSPQDKLTEYDKKRLSHELEKNGGGGFEDLYPNDQRELAELFLELEETKHSSEIVRIWRNS